MNKKFCAILLCVMCLCSCNKQQTSQDQAENAVAESPVEFADPFVMLDGDTYYAYGTMKCNDGVYVYTSDDLETWTPAGLALDKADSHADVNFWAPEIYKVGDNRYLMYYSADCTINVAESESPLGPFKEVGMKPMIDAKAIDNSLFIDTDGKAYLFFDIFGEGTEFLSVYMAELEDDLTTVKENTITKCIGQSQPWEEGSVNEGSFVTKYGDTYYMTYSGNGYTDPTYGVGVATAKSPYGPWTKYEGNPIFQFPETEKYGKLEGVGHSAMFMDKDGNRRIVFHAHKIPGQQVDPREMYFSTYSFTEGDEPMMQISAEDITKAISNE